jgi:tRNA pseudouridine38-40 synthase
MRYRAKLAYDGTRFHGFQRQANAAPTVQGEVEDALRNISGQHVPVIGAGRTDAGVHALGQVIAFDMTWRHSEADLRNALNANLPQDIATRHVQQADPDFHPRFDALSRRYAYRVYVSPVRDPMQRRVAWHLKSDLDVAEVQAAVRCLIGDHDFSTFGTPPQGNNSVRSVYQARWETGEDGWHTFTITANAFLYRMVRSIVGTLVLVGRKHMTSDAFAGILASCRRNLSGAAAPPHGLTLVSVDYE